ncbi:MAG: hypothetical protein M3Z24_16190 [Chloroflexota bacterium]|nr:hypothetical protein [Chloroflexota bacterium]
MTCTSNTLVFLREGLGGFSITHSGILRDGAFARQLTPQRCAFKAISIGSTKARTRDFLLVLELYHLFCYIVGGVVSPLLRNIYLNKLDEYMEETLIPAYTKGTRRQPNPAYNALLNEAAKLRRKGKHQEAGEVRKQAQHLPSVNPNDPEYRRLKYVRYADDWLVGFVGPKV